MSKHLTLDNRITIEQSLNNNVSLRKISTNLGKAGSTISREIKNHAYSSTKGAPHRTTNRCINRRNCKITGICEDKPNCTSKCSTCYCCNSHCPQFVEEICQRLSSSPYVCNGCTQLQKCTLTKLFYNAAKANNQYRHLLVNCRQGAKVTEEKLLQIDKTLFPLIIKGQSVHPIMITHGDSFIASLVVKKPSTVISMLGY